jgi:hypothetical protein
VAKHRLLPLQGAIQQALEQLQRRPGGLAGLGQAGEDPVAGGVRQRGANSAGHGPGGMDPASAKLLDDLLAELAQADAGAGQLRIGDHQAKHVAAGGIALPAEQEIRAAEMEEGQGMALGELGQIQQPAQLAGRWGNLHRQQLVAGFGGAEQMAHGADAADAGRDPRHVREGAPLAEFFKAPILHHVKPRVAEAPLTIQVEGDFGVALDAGHRVDQNGAAHGGVIRNGAGRGPPAGAARRPAGGAGPP